ncbi:antibiotic biosynthesis monooxygenase family protein [Limibacter armeniacum]|uniref:putative quinol monooxygenase n=1 Tax=Limibacter armeniacum TaxID=466084 RepID=UPI002FE583F6
MLVRIVRMTFRKEEIDTFLSVFNEAKKHIRSFEGCNHLELMRDMDKPNILMTYSYWDSPDALEKYRHSELFKSTWAKTKVLFDDKPVAYSVERVQLVVPE